MKKKSLVIGMVTISSLLGITGCAGKLIGGDNSISKEEFFNMKSPFSKNKVAS